MKQILDFKKLLSNDVTQIDRIKINSIIIMIFYHSDLSSLAKVVIVIDFNDLNPLIFIETRFAVGHQGVRTFL